MTLSKIIVKNENGGVRNVGHYRFRTDMNGTPFWSEESNHCTLPGCETVDVQVTVPVGVTVVDTFGTPQVDVPLYTFSGGTYMNYSGVTDANGQVFFTLPQGDHRFRGDSGGTQYWSSETDACTLPGCTSHRFNRSSKNCNLSH